MPDGKVWFGYGLGAWNGADLSTAAESVRLVVQADREGLDLFTVTDHPYFLARWATEIVPAVREAIAKDAGS